MDFTLGFSIFSLAFSLFSLGVVLKRQRRWPFNGAKVVIQRVEDRSAVTRHYALYVADADQRMIVTVAVDGSHEFGPGITDKNVWREVAKAISPDVR